MTLMLWLVITPVVLLFVIFGIIFVMDRYSDEDDWYDWDDENEEEEE